MKRHATAPRSLSPDTNCLELGGRSIPSYRFSAAVAFALAVGVPQSARATTLSHCDFSDVSDLAMNGSASQSGTQLQLTTGATSEAGSVYYDTAIPWTSATSFHTSFQFHILPTTTEAEGLTFILQDASDGATALGGTGNKIGYGGITPSIEIEFDTYKDSWDPNDNHVAVMANGAYKTHLAVGTPSFTMAGGGVLYAWVDYDGASTELDVFLSQTATKPSSPLLTFDDAVDVVGSSIFVGFTSGSGASIASEQDILEWEFSTDGVTCTCGGDGECLAPTTCEASSADPGESLCASCSTNAECDSDINSGTPICSSSGSSSACRACESSAECTAPLAPLCAMGAPYAGQCVTCLNDSDCAANSAGHSCLDNGSTSVCGGCTKDSQCSAPTPTCVTSLGDCGCATSAECGAGLCDTTALPAGRCVAVLDGGTLDSGPRDGGGSDAGRVRLDASSGADGSMRRDASSGGDATPSNDAAFLTPGNLAGGACAFAPRRAQWGLSVTLPGAAGIAARRRRRHRSANRAARQGGGPR